VGRWPRPGGHGHDTPQEAMVKDVAAPGRTLANPDERRTSGEIRGEEVVVCQAHRSAGETAQDDRAVRPIYYASCISYRVRDAALRPSSSCNTIRRLCDREQHRELCGLRCRQRPENSNCRTPTVSRCHFPLRPASPGALGVRSESRGRADRGGAQGDRCLGENGPGELGVLGRRPAFVSAMVSSANVCGRCLDGRGRDSGAGA
jgi:hypothetical protein